MTWPGRTEHAALYAVATDLIATLEGIRGRLRHGDTHYVFHSDAADRCRSLSFYLSSALNEAERDYYAPALGSIRSAMEHVYIDKLIFLGQRYVQIFRDIDETTWEIWQAEKASGTGWADVTSWSRSPKGRVRITREGLHSEPDENGNTQTIGPHYFLLREYSPFVGPPDVQQYFDNGLSNVDQRRAEAERHKYMHREYLKWESLKESLKANGFADDELLRRLDVHFRFLSAFVHPNTDVLRLVYGRNSSWPSYDHYSSEAILLYITVLAVEELRSFIQMAERPPTVKIDNGDKITQLCDRAWNLSSYFWYPGQRPHDHDRFQEANRRGFRQRRAGNPLVETPQSLSDDDIGYYAQPLQRLIELHCSKQELMTGFAYQSPWPRQDAQWR
jgi:hypothetical protein